MPDLWLEEFVCFRNMLRLRAHLRPVKRYQSVILRVGERKIELEQIERDGFVELQYDGQIDGLPKMDQVSAEIDGERLENLHEIWLKRDPVQQLLIEARSSFLKRISSSTVLELGSRDRDDTSAAWMEIRRSRRYIGVDIVPGPNVDIACDAHELSRHIAAKSIDLVYSQWVYEHLAMPWVVTAELNKVMSLGAEVLILTNHTMALHDMPWDFWRFSESAFKALFNEQTGFEVLGTALGEPMHLTPRRYHEGHKDHQEGIGWLSAAVWARKIADSSLTWGVNAARIEAGLGKNYPDQIR